MFYELVVSLCFFVLANSLNDRGLGIFPMNNPLKTECFPDYNITSVVHFYFNGGEWPHESKDIPDEYVHRIFNVLDLHKDMELDRLQVAIGYDCLLEKIYATERFGVMKSLQHDAKRNLDDSNLYNHIFWTFFYFRSQFNVFYV